MDSKITFTMSTQLGNLSLEIKEGKLLSLLICDNQIPTKERNGRLDSDSKSNVLETTLQQLKDYFSSAISFQDIFLSPNGTSFQKSVWHELSKIPLGETCTYGDIAKKLKSSARAVGNACRKNPIQIIIPCHRVISANGIGGYAGETDGKQLNIKHWLLNHEGVAL